MRRLLICSALIVACHPTAPPRTALAVATDPEPAAAAREAPLVASDEFEFFREDVEIEDGERYLGGGSHEVDENRMLVGDARLGPLGLLDKKSLTITPVPQYLGKPKERPTLTSAAEHGAVIASFFDDEAGVVEFQVLRLSSLRWEKAGRFDVPESRAVSEEESRLTRSWVRMVDGELRLDLSDEIENQQSYVLDFETLVWREVDPRPIDHGPCLMSTVHADDDRVRWGMSPPKSNTQNAGPCVAIRSTLDAPWERVGLESPNDELIFLRQIHPIDEHRFLVTGGFAFKFLPFVYQADIVDVQKKSIRSLGKQIVGTKLDVPGDGFVWVNQDTVVRFDPESEQFSTSPGPQLDFNPRWWITLDERRVLFAGENKAKEPRFVIAGFRPVRSKP